MRRFLLACLFLLAAPSCFAHVGSPDVYFEGSAGPYRLFVTVRMPPVIPGVAEIEIRSESPDIREIRIVPMRLTGAGSELAPTPDRAEQSKADPQFFTGRLWLMEFHALQVRMEVDGARGHAELAVPVMAEAQRTLRMHKSLGALLLGLVLLLAVGLVSIAHAAAGEARLEPGAAPQPEYRRRTRIVTGAAALVVLCLLFLGNKWWDLNANDYERFILTPPRFSASLEPGGRLVLNPPQGEFGLGRGNLQLSEFTQPRELLPDHGHLMHLFLVRVPGLDRFAHLHPEASARGQFSAELPSLPAGRYQMFADVVRKSGLALTLVGEVDLPEVAGKPLAGDDSAAANAPLGAAAAHSVVSTLSGGARMVWEPAAAPLHANQALRLKFRVEEKDGKPEQDLEPYMGMAGHMAVIRSDLSVFAHVHPSGSMPMATVELAQASLLGGARDALDTAHTAHATAEALPPEVSFPYGFPQPGDYRLFVQVKLRGRVETGVFDVHIIP